MIFVDTNVFMYAVGKQHPLRDEAREFFAAALRREIAPLCSSAEVLQELVHAYLPVDRLETLGAAFQLAESLVDEIWPIEAEDVRASRALIQALPALGARDLLHVATCRRRSVREIKTFDRRLAAAF